MMGNAILKSLATAACSVLIAGSAFAAPPHFEGFEDSGWVADMTDNWQDYTGTIARATSGTNGIISATGGAHAIVSGAGANGPYTRFGGYSSEFFCGYVASLTIYLDPAWADGTGFDYSVAANGQDGNHQRDFIWHVGVVSGTGLLVNASNNTDGAFNAFKLLNENLGFYYEVPSAGWYRFEQVFYDNGVGELAVDFNLYNSSNVNVYTVTRSSPADVIATEVGGNRYGWFTYNTINNLAIDDTSLQHGAGCGELSLETSSCQDDTDAASGYQIEVELWMRDLPSNANGFQAFLTYDDSVLTYRGDLSSYSTGPFPQHIQNIATADVAAGEIRLDGSDVFLGPGTASDSLLATLVFDVLVECDETEVAFDLTQAFDSELSLDGFAIPTLLSNTGGFVNDDTPPTITCPPNISVYADAGTCEAVVDVYQTVVETFDDPVVTSATQAPGVWYTDRYAPSDFTNDVFLGEPVLRHSINASDCSPCRGGGFTSAFYDTQGRKLDTPGSTRMSIDLYIPSDWATTQRRMAGFWGTAFDASNAVSYYPIIEFTSTTDGSGVPRFRYYSSELGDWIDMGLPSGFAYDAWYTLSIELVGGTFVATVGDLTLVDNQTFGSVEIGNVILQGHNNTAGVTYDIYWDNFAQGVGAVLEDNCQPGTLTAMRSDSLALDDPYPSGVTTMITWIGTDACGNETQCVSTVTVADTNLVEVEVELVGVFTPVTRCIHFVLDDCSQYVDVSMSFVDHDSNGATPVRAMDSIEVPCGSWTQLCAKDQQHTLWATSGLTIVGTEYVATSVHSLEPGDNDNDGDVDINDVTFLIATFGGPEAVGGCPWNGMRGADFSNNGNVGSEDYSLLSGNWLSLSMCSCTNPLMAPSFTVDKSIPIDKIEARMRKRLDLNGDGVFDYQDVRRFEQINNLPSTLSNRLAPSQQGVTGNDGGNRR